MAQQSDQMFTNIIVIHHEHDLVSWTKPLHSDCQVHIDLVGL